MPRFGGELQKLLTSYCSDSRLADCRIVFELGRYLVAEAGVYVTRVVDAKRSRGKTFLITDGGMNHHLTGTGNFGQVFRKPFPLLNLTRMAGNHGTPWLSPGLAAHLWTCSEPASPWQERKWEI